MVNTTTQPLYLRERDRVLTVQEARGGRASLDACRRYCSPLGFDPRTVQPQQVPFHPHLSLLTLSLHSHIQCRKTTITPCSAVPQYLIQHCGTVYDVNTRETDSRFVTWIQQNSKTTVLIISQYIVPDKHCDEDRRQQSLGKGFQHTADSTY